jgi:hypothetical protein
MVNYQIIEGQDSRHQNKIPNETLYQSTELNKQALRQEQGEQL